MDEKLVREKLAGLDEAGKNRALARLIKMVAERGDRARNLALGAAREAINSAKFALDSAKLAQNRGAPDKETLNRLAKQEQAIQQALQKAEAAIKAADSLEPGRKRMEEHMKALTRTEKKVYLQLARGMTDKEIAKGLGISARTAQMHVTNIKGKLRIDDRDDFILPSPLLS